jgi:hypothetical protein
MNSFNGHITENMHKFSRDFQQFRNIYLSDVSVPEYEAEERAIEKTLSDIYKYTIYGDNDTRNKFNSPHDIMKKHKLSNELSNKFNSKL